MHCTYTVGSANVKVQNINMLNSITCAMYCNYRTDGTLDTPDIWFI